MNKQNLVDQIFKHFITDKQPAGYDLEKKSCTYTNPPCAIGIFFTEEDLQLLKETYGDLGYSDEIESMISDLYSCGKKLSSALDYFVDEERETEYYHELSEGPDEIITYSATFLRELQQAHDHSATVSSCGRSPKASTSEEFIEKLTEALKDICIRHVLKFPGDA